jgi:hypothetical protein
MKHKKKGHKVPDYALKRILDEIDRGEIKGI